MKYSQIAAAHMLSQPVYEAGKPIEYVAREFGLNPMDIAKLASNENPLGASPKALDAIKKNLQSINIYPDGGAFFLREKLAKKLSVKDSQIVVANGSNEIFDLLCHSLIEKDDEIIMGKYSFIAFKISAMLMQAKCVMVDMPNLAHNLDLLLDAITPRTKIIYLPNPNNPTGTVNTPAEVEAFIKKVPDNIVVCYDQAYAEYEETSPDLIKLLKENKKLVITRTFSKIYGLAGMRVGYAICEDEMAKLLNASRLAFNVNSLALVAAEAALDDNEFVEKSKKLNKEGFAQFEKSLSEMGIKIVGTGGNFILINVKDGLKVFNYLQEKGVIIRPVASYGLKEFVRISIGTKEQNQRCLDLLKEVINL